MSVSSPRQLAKQVTNLENRKILDEIIREGFSLTVFVPALICTLLICAFQLNDTNPFNSISIPATIIFFVGNVIPGFLICVFHYNKSLSTVKNSRWYNLLYQRIDIIEGLYIVCGTLGSGLLALSIPLTGFENIFAKYVILALMSPFVLCALVSSPRVLPAVTSWFCSFIIIVDLAVSERMAIAKPDIILFQVLVGLSIAALEVQKHQMANKIRHLTKEIQYEIESSEMKYQAEVLKSIISNVSHDLLSPLQALEMGLESFLLSINEVAETQRGSSVSPRKSLNTNSEMLKLVESSKSNNTDENDFTPLSQKSETANHVHSLLTGQESTDALNAANSLADNSKQFDFTHGRHQSVTDSVSQAVGDAASGTLSLKTTGIKVMNLSEKLKNDHAAIRHNQHEIVETMQNTLAFMAMIIGRSLDVSKSTGGMLLNSNCEYFDIKDSTNKVIRCVVGMETNAVVDVEFIPNGSDYFLRTDKRWFEGNLLCVLSNAAKYSLKLNVKPIEVNVSLSDHPTRGTKFTCDVCLESSKGLKENSSNIDYGFKFIADLLNNGMNYYNSSRSNSHYGSSNRSHITVCGVHNDCHTQYIKVEVTDSGGSLSEAEMASFFCAAEASSRSQVGGMGMGLFTLAKRIEALGGSYGMYQLPVNSENSCDRLAEMSNAINSSLSSKNIIPVDKQLDNDIESNLQSILPRETITTPLVAVTGSVVWFEFPVDSSNDNHHHNYNHDDTAITHSPRQNHLQIQHQESLVSTYKQSGSGQSNHLKFNDVVSVTVHDNSISSNQMESSSSQLQQQQDQNDKGSLKSLSFTKLPSRRNSSKIVHIESDSVVINIVGTSAGVEIDARDSWDNTSQSNFFSTDIENNNSNLFTRSYFVSDDANGIDSHSMDSYSDGGVFISNPSTARMSSTAPAAEIYVPHQMNNNPDDSIIVQPKSTKHRISNKQLYDDNDGDDMAAATDIHLKASHISELSIETDSVAPKKNINASVMLSSVPMNSASLFSSQTLWCNTNTHTTNHQHMNRSNNSTINVRSASIIAQEHHNRTILKDNTKSNGNNSNSYTRSLTSSPKLVSTTKRRMSSKFSSSNLLVSSNFSATDSSILSNGESIFGIDLTSPRNTSPPPKYINRGTNSPQLQFQQQQGFESTQSLSVLVVDDSLPIMRMTQMSLMKAGHKVETAKNGKFALDMMKSAEYDVVLMDIQMPVMGGIESTRLLREYEKEVIMSNKTVTVSHDNGNLSTIFESTNRNSGKSYGIGSYSESSISDNLTSRLSSPMNQKYTNRSVVSNNSSLQLHPSHQYSHHRSKRQLIIGMSANGEASTREEAFTNGMDAFVPKPFSLDVLMQVVKDHVQQLQQHQTAVQSQQRQSQDADTTTIDVYDDNNK